MSVFLQLLGHARGVGGLAPDVERALKAHPAAAEALRAARALGAEASPNWTQIVAIIMEIVQAVLPLLHGGPTPTPTPAPNTGGPTP